MPVETWTFFALLSSTVNMNLRPVSSVTAEMGTVVLGSSSSGAMARERNDTFALISGSILLSLSENLILTITEALVLSAVGTIMWIKPSDLSSGSASSCISQGMPLKTLLMFASDTSASTWRVSMSAMVTTAAFAPADAPSGVTMSPMSAFFVSTTPVNGALISEYPSEALAPRNAARAELICAWAAANAAEAFLKRASAMSKTLLETKPPSRSPLLRSQSCIESTYLAHG